MSGYSALKCGRLRVEHVGKEVMIAIPLARVIERHDKEVAAMERL